MKRLNAESKQKRKCDDQKKALEDYHQNCTHKRGAGPVLLYASSSLMVKRRQIHTSAMSRRTQTEFDSSVGDSSCVGDSSSFVSLVLVVADSSYTFFDFSFLFSSTDSISRPASSFSFFCVLSACLSFKCVTVTTTCPAGLIIRSTF